MMIIVIVPFVCSFVVTVHQVQHNPQSVCALKRNTFAEIEAAKAK